MEMRRREEGVGGRRWKVYEKMRQERGKEERKEVRKGEKGRRPCGEGDNTLTNHILEEEFCTLVVRRCQ